ncbi:MAG: threonine synthase [Candidatus Dormibacteraeota bacterium]|nr:threonine synthase [Candidatus Dormibacteraeota bacterium]MBV9525768.1 threonine synthase [Candidatus Dormibacteraeota bacterium]
MSRGVIAAYAELLPVDDHTPRLSLGEGGTPCVESRVIGPRLGLGSLHLKLEGLNPTGSFKDRGMVVAVARALQAGATTLVCASTGNTSASAAAYGARFGLRTAVVVPHGRVASGKLLQAQVHGATVVAVDGGFDAALRIVRELATRPDVALVNSVNPFRLEGQKTAAFEVVDDLGDAPDVLAIPVGNAGNITAYWRGFREYHGLGRCSHLPRMLGAQASGAAPLVRGRVVEHPYTVATAIRIGAPASWQGAVDARDESEGLIDAVDDSEILAAQWRLAQEEGVFCEPASAASVALLEKCVVSGAVAPGTHAVCVITGSGLKDPDAMSGRLTEPVTVTASAAEVAAALGL